MRFFKQSVSRCTPDYSSLRIVQDTLLSFPHSFCFESAFLSFNSYFFHYSPFSHFLQTLLLFSSFFDERSVDAKIIPLSRKKQLRMKISENMLSFEIGSCISGNNLRIRLSLIMLPIISYKEESLTKKGSRNEDAQKKAQLLGLKLALNTFKFSSGKNLITQQSA